ncbi:hypothetical protein Bbelb_348190 [Branchiostoma belcheri]|nr:hypothetical protein Bbelb_348190 [Branchiostoma belcheri]
MSVQDNCVAPPPLTALFLQVSGLVVTSTNVGIPAMPAPCGAGRGAEADGRRRDVVSAVSPVGPDDRHRLTPANPRRANMSQMLFISASATLRYTAQTPRGNYIKPIGDRPN